MHPLGFQRIYFELRVSLLLWGKNHYGGLKKTCPLLFVIKEFTHVGFYFFFPITKKASTNIWAHKIHPETKKLH